MCMAGASISYDFMCVCQELILIIIFCVCQELGTPTEKIWPGLNDLPAFKKCTFAEHPYNQLKNRFGSIITEKGFDLMNR